MEIIILIIILFLFILIDSLIAKSIDSHLGNKQKINVSTNIIHYPSQVLCDKCNVNVFPTRKNIDSSTWDLKCSCGEIVYLHPKREERIEQIKNLLN